MKIRKFLAAAMLLFAAALVITVANPAEADAAAYKELGPAFNTGTTTKSCVKVGSSYFKKNSSGVLSVSASKSSGYKSTGIYYYNAWTNGKSIYYIDGDVLYKYSISKRTASRLKNLSSLIGSYSYEAPYLGISMIYNGNVYITRSSFEEWNFITYRYNTSTKKVTKTKSNCDILVRSGKYCIGQNEYRTDVSPFKITLYKINSSGSLTKVKVLTKNSRGVWLIDGKFYYSVYSTLYLDKMVLYRCSTNGSNKKKLVTVSKSGEEIDIRKVTSKYVVYTYSGSYTKTHKKYY